MLLCISVKSLFLTHKSLDSRAEWNLKDQSQTLSYQLKKQRPLR